MPSLRALLVLGVSVVDLACSGVPPPAMHAAAETRRGHIDVATLHGTSLEHTATGESPDRQVSVYVPPSYAADAQRRYPVVYLLHGILDSDKVWTGNEQPWSSVQDVMDRGIAEGRFGDLIVVMPDERTRAGGSMYTNSTATGAWEDFTVRELVAWVDRTYRTVPRVSARAIAGHSMGGYGALKLAMAHPDVFAAVYAMNPAGLGWGADLTPANPVFAEVTHTTTLDDLVAPPAADPHGMWKRMLIVGAQAFSPEPQRPPLFAALPFDAGAVPTQVFARWEANFLVGHVAAHRDALARLRGIRFDSGYDDQFRFIPPTTRQFSAELTAAGISHVFEEYNGDHRNRLWGPDGRIGTDVLPWLWRKLDHGE